MNDLAKSLGKAVQRSSKSKTQKQGNTESRAEASQPKRGRGGHLQTTNPHTKRLTLDITPEQDRYLALFGIDHGLKKNPTLRALIELLETDDDVRAKILKITETQKS